MIEDTPEVGRPLEPRLVLGVKDPTDEDINVFSVAVKELPKRRTELLEMLLIELELELELVLDPLTGPLNMFVSK